MRLASDLAYPLFKFHTSPDNSFEDTSSISVEQFNSFMYAANLAVASVVPNFRT